MLSVSFVLKTEKKELVLPQQAADLDNLVEFIVELAQLRDIAEDDTYDDMAIALYFILDEHWKWWVTM